MRKLSGILAIMLVLCSLFVLVPSAEEAYDTYTYSIDGEKLLSPDAYSAKDTNKPITSKEMGLLDATNPVVARDAAIREAKYPKDPTKKGPQALKGSTDIVTDEDANVYIADAGNERLVILDKNYRVIQIVSTYTDENGAEKSFVAPNGISITNSADTPNHDSHVYICDSQTKRIVCFERTALLANTDGDYRAEKTILKPDSKLLKDDAYTPIALSVDRYGRIFVVSRGAFEGIIVMSGEGEFTGFIGAQKVTKSLLDQIWGKLMSAEQKQETVQNTSSAYNNITVDADGFIYITNNGLEAAQQFAAITSKTATHSPVKKLNSSGDEIMARNGFFDCGGEVDVLEDSVSSIIDVAVGPEGTWSILDERNTGKIKRSRIFTYNSNGDLLFAFGDKGQQLGNGEAYVGFTYQHLQSTDTDGNTKDVYNILTLDTKNNSNEITVFSPTPYCEKIIEAHRYQNNHKYNEAIDIWKEILKLNNNFDLAYIGIGKALYSQQKYEESMEMLKAAYETDQYAKAFGEVRSEIVGKYLPLIIILIIAVVVLLLKFLGYAKKKNKATSLKVGRKTYWDELVFSFHLIFHPFDGFWDLRHEKRGSVRAATTILGITILAFFYQAIGQGYIFNPRGDYSTVLLQVTAVLVPVLLWCVGNWCLTTLFDGEGGFKDIYIATCYSLAPLPFFVILSTILSNIFSDGSIINLLVSFGYVWVALLLFFGMLVTHNYTMPKNILMIVSTIVAMVVIMFVAILFSTLMIKVVSFFVSIFAEIGNRL